MKFMDMLWEFIDNAAYIMTLLACLLLSSACVAVPVLLLAIHAEIRQLREEVRAHHEADVKPDVTPMPFPHVFPRLRRVGEGE